MRNVVHIIGVLVVAGLLVASGPAFAQDKPAGGQDKKESVAAADPISGDWEGSVESPNGVIAFTLKLKLDKDKLSGEIASAEGGSPISGTWTDGKLSAEFDYNGTPITMNGGVKEGVLSGEMSYGGGQAIMAYSAKRPAAK